MVPVMARACASHSGSPRYGSCVWLRGSTSGRQIRCNSSPGTGPLAVGRRIHRRPASSLLPRRSRWFCSMRTVAVACCPRVARAAGGARTASRPAPAAALATGGGGMDDRPPSASSPPPARRRAATRPCISFILDRFPCKTKSST